MPEQESPTCRERNRFRLAGTSAWAAFDGVERSGRPRIRRRLDRGQGFVEFMLTVPLVLAMVFGIIEAALWFQALNSLQNAAREAARYASTGQPLRSECSGYSTYQECRVDAIKNYAQNLASAGLIVNLSETDNTKPGYLGVEVWGAPCLDGTNPNCDPQLDHPGVAQGKLEVRIDYNHPVANPFFSTWFPTIPVHGYYQIVNEPWFGSQFTDPPGLSHAPTPPPVDTDGDGWSDDYERDYTLTYPNRADSDSDGCYEGDGTLTPTEPSAAAAMDACVPASCPNHPPSCP